MESVHHLAVPDAFLETDSEGTMAEHVLWNHDILALVETVLFADILISRNCPSGLVMMHWHSISENTINSSW